MKKIAIITFNLCLAAFFIASAEWFEHEREAVASITSEYQDTTQKLQKISQINKWLEEVMAQSTKKDGDFQVSDENLITFFDTNKEHYHLLIEKYIYQEGGVKKIGLTHDVELNSIQKIASLLDLSYKEGFLQFKELNIIGGKLTGKFDVVQPQTGDANVSKH
ncbi:MAG: hypothetical protein OEL19_08745 [Sulfurimonas sp.]|nr:hypothetical protein [Sulfurimonas sp.]